MIPMENKGVILEKSDLEFENRAVLNPTCIEKDGKIHMFYRAVPESWISSIGYCQIEDGKVTYRADKPVIFPENDYEIRGIEDPRVVEMDGVYYMFYVAYDGQNARIAYAVSTDLTSWDKKGIISPNMSYDEAEDLFRGSQVREKYLFYEAYFKDVVARDVILWEKDGFIFPKRINGKIALVHRVLPGIQVIYADSFEQLQKVEYWREYFKEMNQHIILDSEYKFENRNVGGGCPPIELNEGWLLIYHAVEDRPSGKVYHAAAALLDKEDPTKILARLPEPLFSPESDEELFGDVNSVVFPTAAIVKDGQLDVYYGAADSRIMLKSMKLQDLMDAFHRYTKMHRQFSTAGSRQKIAKPWGNLTIFTPKRAIRTGKIMEIEAGKRLSLHYHEKKDETVTLYSGKAKLHLENNQGEIDIIDMKLMAGYHIEANKKHRAEAIEDSVLFEVSSADAGSTVRVEDDFGRLGERGPDDETNGK